MRPFSSCSPQAYGSGASIATAACSILALLAMPAMAAQKTAADYFVKSLPGAPEGPLLKMHAGFVEVNPTTNANLFFWHFQNRHIANRQRTVIWLNGGPGCSSEDGAMMEIGPYRMKHGKNGKELEYNDGSWDEFANIMFVDNPVGTGYSYVNGDSYLHELGEMADQMVVFLEKWFEMFPHFAVDDLYFAGESYAGQHIPYIAKAILERNKKTSDATKHWNLKGLVIGNGWISPVDQYPSYLTYSYKNGVVTQGSSAAATIESQQAQCMAALSAPGGHDRVDLQVCEQILQEILKSTITKKKGTTDRECVNMYDIRLRDTWPSCGMNWPPDLPDVTTWLRRSEVMRALNVEVEGHTPTPWNECYGPVGGAFTVKNSRPSVQLLPDILKEVPIVLFSGASDLICNHIGTEDLINNLSWNGGKGFEITPGTWAPRRDWMFEGESAGFWQEARNLTYVLFHNSSHMVPFDYARRTRDMLDRFMRVDIANIGGKPTDSRIDGEKGLETSVGGHPNSTAAEEAQKEKLAAAKWSAYYRSGEIALIVVIVMAGLWGWYVWRDRRSRAGYTGVFGGLLPGDSSERLRGAMGLENMRHKRGDVETGDFDVEELDDLSRQGRHHVDGQYDIGSDSDEEDMGNGKVNGEHKAKARESYDVPENK